MTPVVGKQADGAPEGLLRSEARFELGGAQGTLLHEAVVRERVARGAHDTFHTATGQGGEAVHGEAFARQAAGDGERDRVIRTAGQARGDGRGIEALLGTQHLLVHEGRLARRDRARLVERDHLQRPGRLEVGATLDQDAAARAGGQSTDDRDRGRDDEGAGAGDHEQHEGLVDRVQPADAHQRGGQHRHRDGNREHGRCVDGGEPVDETLCGRPRGLGLLDRVDDAREGGVGGGGGDPERQFAGLVDGAREDDVTRGLVDRQAFARDGRLVDGARAGGDHAVERHPFARADAHDGFQRHGGRRHAGPGAVGLLHLGLLGSQREKALDGVACTVRGAGLDQLGDGVERHHHRGLGPLADHERTGHGHRHQRVDVQAAAPQRREPLRVRLDAGQPDRHGCDREAGPLQRGRVTEEEVQRLGTEREQQGQGEALHAGGGAMIVVAVGMVVTVVMVVRMVALGVRVRRRCAAERLRCEARGPDGCQRCRNHLGRGPDGQRAGPELEPQPLDAGDRFQGAADLAFLHGAVHRGDAEGGAVGDDGCLGHLRRGGRGRTPSAAAGGRGRRGDVQAGAGIHDAITNPVAGVESSRIFSRGFP